MIARDLSCIIKKDNVETTELIGLTHWTVDVVLNIEQLNS